MGAKDYEVVLCNNGFLYINKDDGNDAISKDSKRLSERDLEEIRNWIDKNHEYVRADAFIEKACNKLAQLMYDQHLFEGRLHQDAIIENFVGDFENYMKGE